MGFLSVIIVGIIVYVLIVYIKKENEKKAKAAKEEELRQQAEERKRREIEEDKKYDRIINCPACKGSGDVYIEYYWRYEEDYGDYDEATKALLSAEQYQRDYLTSSPNKQADRNARLETCPFCGGEGIAYARFEKSTSSTKNCTHCGGTGKVSTRVKLEIGMGEQQVNCNTCKGTGKIPQGDIVHVKTLKAGIKGFMNFESYNTVEITDENRSFYATSKPRFS